MRIKILLFPVVLIVSLWLAIGYIWPDIQKIGEKRKVVGEQEALLADVTAKNNRILALKASLGSRDEQSQYRKDEARYAEMFLPPTKQEEDIINSLNSYASGLVVVNIALNEIKPTTGAAAAVAQPTLGSASAQVAVTTDKQGKSIQSPTYVEPKPLVVEAKITAVGKYEDMKQFLNKVYHMEMLNEVPTVTVGYPDQGSDPNSLKMEGAFRFEYLPMVSLPTGTVKNYNDAIFKKDSFDFASIAKVREFARQALMPLGVINKNRPNPFVLGSGSTSTGASAESTTATGSTGNSVVAPTPTPVQSAVPAKTPVK
ncbi:hypothetical protein EPO05_05295 [Patescibacteria group bacterium]|nr:MAG: hypothetical protein EPO05_05295 [Patescibacteria group bacterium]